MSTTDILCENCGKPLSAAEAVCTGCEAKMRNEIDSPARGKYLCPVCEQRFARPRHELWPRGAKWYVPRQFKPTCPLCRSFLRDRKNPALPANLVLLLIAAALVVQLAVPVAYTKAAFALLIITYLFLHLRQRERNVQASARFSKDED